MSQTFALKQERERASGGPTQARGGERDREGKRTHAIVLDVEGDVRRPEWEGRKQREETARAGPKKKEGRREGGGGKRPNRRAKHQKRPGSRKHPHRHCTGKRLWLKIPPVLGKSGISPKHASRNSSENPSKC